VKVRSYNPKTGMESLVVTMISQASAQQRSGRAGRVKPGKSYRLYTEQDFLKFSVSTVPEMQKTNLAPVILQLKALGIDDVLHFDFMSAPPADNMIRALELLYALGALDDNAKLTPSPGSIMAEFPVEPMFAKMLITSGLYKCSEEMLSIAAMISVQNIFVGNSEYKGAKLEFAVHEGDHITLLNIFNTFMYHKKRASAWCQKHNINYKAMLRAVDIRKQLRKYLKKFNIPMESCNCVAEPILKCLVSGFFANAAQRQPDNSYRSVKENQELHLHPGSVLFKFPPPWVVYNEVVQTTKLFMKDVTAIEPKWLVESANHFYEFKKTKAQLDQEKAASEMELPPNKYRKLA